MTTKTFVLEVVILLVILVAVEWLFVTLTHGQRNLPALLAVLAVYLGVRVAVAIFRRPS